MKRFLLPLVLLLVLALPASAQSGFGIKGGFNFNSMSDVEFNSGIKSSIEKKTGFHAGVLYKWDLPFGLALQPELLYSQKGGSVDVGRGEAGAPDLGDGEFTAHYLQLPVNIQWGLDLMLFRPFIMVSPYVNYLISNECSIKGLDWDVERFGYGIGIGAGLDIWRFQVTGKYNWDLGEVSEFTWDGLGTFKGGKNRNFELSLAFIF